ncbi:MAG: thioredoxin family protein [Methanomassiliicoccales archaeon]
MKIEVLGTGCAKCRRVKKNVEKALKDLSMDAEVMEVDDLQEITDRGVMMTPALYVDGEAKAVGRVPSKDEIKEMLGA